jgi:hypothetical protein
MSVSREVDKLTALLILVFDLKMSEDGAESLLAEAAEHPGDWRRADVIKVRKNADGKFSVRG